jgi:hypothetical protein
MRLFLWRVRVTIITMEKQQYVDVLVSNVLRPMYCTNIRGSSDIDNINRIL